MSQTNNPIEQFRHFVRRAAPAAAAVIALGSLAGCKAESLNEQVERMYASRPESLAITPADLAAIRQTVHLQTAEVKPNTHWPEVGSSGAPAYSAVLDLTRNTLTWFDREGSPTDAPMEMDAVERAQAAGRVVTTGSLQSRYAGAGASERQRLEREPTRVFNCWYENVCLAQVDLLRGAPGDPRGYTDEARQKEEGGEVRYLSPEWQRGEPLETATLHRQSGPDLSQRDRRTMEEMAAIRTGSSGRAASTAANSGSYSQPQSAPDAEEEQGRWERIGEDVVDDQMREVEWHIRDVARGVTRAVLEGTREAIQRKGGISLY